MAEVQTSPGEPAPTETAEPAKTPLKWRLLFWFTMTMAALGILATLLGLADKIVNFGALPRCGSKQAKDTLSNLNKANNVNASHYNSTKTISSTEDEVRCTANLALKSGGNLEYDYRFFREGKETRVEITRWQPPQ